MYRTSRKVTARFSAEVGNDKRKPDMTSDKVPNVEVDLYQRETVRHPGRPEEETDATGFLDSA